MDQAQHAVPASLGAQMHQSLYQTVKYARGITRSIIAGSRLHGPINQNGPANDGIAPNKTPIAAVPAAVAIIAHREIFVIGNDQFPVLHMIEDLHAPLAPQSRLQKITVCRREIIAKRISVSRIVDHVRLIEPFSIDENLLVDNAEHGRQEDQ